MLVIDKNQGITDSGKKFGYICGDEGGWFFTWHDTDEETLNSLEVDCVDGDGGIEYQDARKALKAIL
jgi:hypothetical protein